MRWPFGRRKDQAGRGDDELDPVAAVLADAGPLTALFGEPGERIEPADVAEWVAAEAVDDAPRGFRVLVSFADECWLLADSYDDDLEAQLAAQPGIDAAMQEDRETIWVRSRLPVERMRAAAVVALLAAHRAAAARRVEGVGGGDTDGG